MNINNYYRYDFFTIWGNGINNKEGILNILRSEKYIEIISIEKKNYN